MVVEFVLNLWSFDVLIKFLGIIFNSFDSNVRNLKQMKTIFLKKNLLKALKRLFRIFSNRDGKVLILYFTVHGDFASV